MPRVLFLNIWIGSLVLTGAARVNNVGFLSTSLQEYTEANCNFQGGTCGWTNAGDNDVTVRWQRKRLVKIPFSNFYMSAEMRNRQPNSTARLVSQWFKPTRNRQYTLSFRYYMGGSNRCQFSVYLSTASDRHKLWSTSTGTLRLIPPSLFSAAPPIHLPSTTYKHQIVFEGRKLSDADCTIFPNVLDSIGLDDIEFHHLGNLPVTPTTEPFHKDQTKAGLSTGAKAGIFVAVASVVIVPVILLIVCLKKRSAGGSHWSCCFGKEEGLSTSTQSVSNADGNINPAYTADQGETPGSGESNAHTGGDNGVYENCELTTVSPEDTAGPLGDSAGIVQQTHIYNIMSLQNPRFPNPALANARPYSRMIHQIRNQHVYGIDGNVLTHWPVYENITS